MLRDQHHIELTEKTEKHHEVQAHRERERERERESERQQQLVRLAEVEKQLEKTREENEALLRKVQTAHDQVEDTQRHLNVVMAKKIYL